MIIAVDFDGTLCENEFPKIGEANTKLLKQLRTMQTAGHQIILWTCRSGSWLSEAVAWCKEQGLNLAAVNEDTAEIKASYFGKNKSVKVFAHIYIDDANWDIDKAARGSFPLVGQVHKIVSEEEANAG